MSAPMDPSQLRRLKTLRQKRLREVGEAGQARIGAATLRLDEDDAAAEIALRYVVGAGVHRLQLQRSLWPLATALDPAWTPHVPSESESESVQVRRAAAPDFLQDDGARAVFVGALSALTTLRTVLSPPPPPAVEPAA